MYTFKWGKRRFVSLFVSILMCMSVIIDTSPVPVEAEENQSATGTVESDSASSTSGSIITDFDPTVVETKETVDGITFTHPGIYCSADDLERMQHMVRIGQDPWASAFDKFRADPRASKDYTPINDGTLTCFSDNNGYAATAARKDSNAAYAQAIMWYVTGDPVYSENARKIIRTWGESLSLEAFASYEIGGTGAYGYGWSADIIDAGIIATKFSFAGDILRYTPGSGWADEDTAALERYLDITFPMIDRVDKFMNQTGYTVMGLLSAAIFKNDAAMYREAIDRATVNSRASWPWCDISIERQLRLIDQYYDTATGQYVQVDEPQVQLVEMGRDQPHAADDAGVLEVIAQTAYVQGTKVNEDGKIVTQDAEGNWTYDDWNIEYTDGILQRYTEGDTIPEGKKVGNVKATLTASNVASTTQGSGLWEFLDNRILKALGYAAKYNLGYEVTWYPVRYDYSNLPDSEVTSSAYYNSVSYASRGTAMLGKMFTAYYHYKYVDNINTASDDYDSFQYIEKAVQLLKTSSGEVDFIVEADLLLAPEEAAVGDPKGEPLELTDSYETATTGFNRYQAVDFTGKSQGGMIRSDYTDEFGTRSMTDGISDGQYFWYKDYNFGSEPVDSFILSSASNSSQGGSIQVILLDNVTVSDWNNLTESELLQGTVIVNDWTGGTGWWTSFKEKVFQLPQELEGTHSFAIKIGLSDNVYKLCANLDWFCFADSYGYTENQAVAADVISSNAVKDDSAVTLSDGQGFGYDQMDLDRGNSGLTVKYSAAEAGCLNLYSGTCNSDGSFTKSSLVTSYELPSTNGSIQTLDIPPTDMNSVKGIQDIYFEYTGTGTASIVTVKFYVYEENVVIPPTEAEDYTTLRVGGSAEMKAEGDVSYITQTVDSTVVYFNMYTTNDILSIKVRNSSTATLEFRSNYGNAGSEIDPYAVFYIPDTKGEWQTVQFDLEAMGVTLSTMNYVTVKGGNLDLDYYSYQSDNLSPVIYGVSFDPSAFHLDDSSVSIPTDYIFKDTPYILNVNAYDPEQSELILSQDGIEGGSVSGSSILWTPSAAGTFDYTIYVSDGSNLSYINRRAVVFDSLDALISELTKNYNPDTTYSTTTLADYEDKLAAVNALRAGGMTDDMVTALKNLETAANNLWSMDRTITLADGSTVLDLPSIAGFVKSDGNDGTEAYKYLTDCDSSTCSDLRLSGGWGGYLTIDMKEGYGVNLTGVSVLARQDKYYTRVGGAIIEGSNDGIIWKTLTSSAVSTAEWQNLTITDTGTYRYLRFSNPTQAWYGNAAELHLMGNYVEWNLKKAENLSLVTISSDAANPSTALPGNTVTLKFTSPNELSETAVKIKDTTVSAVSEDKKTWTATFTVTDTVSIGDIPFSIDYAEAADTIGDTVTQTTDNSSVTVLEEDGFISNSDILSLATFRSLRSDNGYETEDAVYNAVKYAFDGNPSTFMEFRDLTGKGWGVYTVIDFTGSYGVTLDKIKILARSDQAGRMNGADIMASNDGENWTTLVENLAGTKNWQACVIPEEYKNTTWRYLKICNDGVNWFGSTAELKLYGEIIPQKVKPQELTSVSIASDNENPKIALPGDTVTLSIASEKPLTSATVNINGSEISAVTGSALTLNFTYPVTDSTPLGNISFVINYQDSNGVNGNPVTSTTDSSSIEVVSDTGLIEDVLHKISAAYDSKERSVSDVLTSAACIFDRDDSTFSDFRHALTNGKGAYVIFDFGDGKGVRLDKIKALARMDDYGAQRIESMVVLGSNDMNTWTELTSGMFRTNDWQERVSKDTVNSYRYLKVYNYRDWYGNVAELRLYGDIVNKSVPTVTDAVISPDTVSFDKNNQADVTANIVWNSASAVTDITSSGVSIGAIAYSVSGSALTISKDYLSAQPTQVLPLTVQFDCGNTATLLINIIDTTIPTVIDAVISPDTANFDKNSQADVTANIVWNSASAITDITSNGVSIGTGAYAVSGSALTINKDYLSAQPTQVLPLTVQFDCGNAATLLINIIDTTVPTVTDAVISPDTVSFDKNNQADVTANIVWNSASAVTDITASGVSIGAGAYSVSGSALTISKEYLSAQPTQVLPLTVQFNCGNPAIYLIVITNSKKTEAQTQTNPVSTPTPTSIIDKVPVVGMNASIDITISKPDEKGILIADVVLPTEQILAQAEDTAAKAEPVDVTIPVSSEQLIELTKSEDTKTVQIVVNLSKDIADNENVNLNLQLDENLLTTIKELNKDVTISAVDENGKEQYSWTFTGDDLNKSDQPVTNVNLSLSVNTLNEELKMADELQKDKNSHGLVVDFEHEGELPAQASVRIYVGDQEGIKAGDKVYLYHYNSAVGKLETLPYSSNYKVDQDGYITINILHCSDYVILTEKADKSEMVSLRNQIVVTPAEKTLYLDGTQNSSCNIQIDLPDTLKLVYTLKDFQTSSAMGIVKVQYKSSNNDIATVSSDGKIEAKKAGVAFITTKLTLYSGKIKTVVTKITVK